jgi:uncharacterized protein
MMNWALTLDDLRDIEVGAAILGTGGGGNPWLGRLRAELVLKDHAMRVVPLDALDDNAKIVALGGVGAPMVSIERVKEGREGLRALRALEAHLDFNADAIACQEIGGANCMEPLIVAALAGLPVVDCDGMGRAFPEMQMTTYSIYGHSSTPSAMSDPHGNVVIFDRAMSEHWHERMVRATMIAQGGSSTLCIAPMTGAYLKRAAVPGSYTRACDLGRAVREGREMRKNSLEVITAREAAREVYRGKITDLKREITGGFVRGEVMIEGFDGFAGQHGQVSLQNEYLVFRRNGEVEVIVPDLISILDADEGTALSTDMLRYGQRISVLHLPAHPLLKTPEALAVIGPEAFGFTGI